MMKKLMLILLLILLTGCIGCATVQENQWLAIVHVNYADGPYETHMQPAKSFEECTAILTALYMMVDAVSSAPYMSATSCLNLKTFERKSPEISKKFFQSPDVPKAQGSKS